MAKKSEKAKKSKKANEVKPGKLDKSFYESEMKRLQGELVKLQYWVKAKDLRVVILFEGRDAAGKGGVIKRITHLLSQFPYEELPREKVNLGKRSMKGKYDDQATLGGRRFIPDAC